MPETSVSERVRNLIFEHIDSVEQLEILLFLREHPERSWTSQEISTELRSSQASVEKRIAVLVSIGLVSQNAKNFTYDPAREDLVRELSETYKIRPHRVLELIFSPMKRARHFADAFMVPTKKNGENDG